MKKKILSIFLILSMVFTTFIATSIKSNAYSFTGGSFGSGGANTRNALVRVDTVDALYSRGGGLTTYQALIFISN